MFPFALVFGAWGVLRGRIRPRNTLPSALRRVGIVAVAVLVLDAPVLAVNHQLRLLVLRDLPRPVDRVLLAIEDLGIPLGAGPPDSPLVVPRNDVLIAI